MLISKYGFSDVLEANRIVLDPSRVAAQIVSGVGFLGAGIIFVRRDSVHGLTTAAAIWVTAAVGASAGAGLPVLAAVTTGIYLVVAVVFQIITDRLPEPAGTGSVIRVRYPEGQRHSASVDRTGDRTELFYKEIAFRGLTFRWRR